MAYKIKGTTEYMHELRDKRKFKEANMKDVTDISKVKTAINNNNLVTMNSKDCEEKMLQEDYNLYFQEKLKRSQKDIKNGRVITLEQLEEERKSLYESYTIK